jgi:hypothetical protein
MMRIFVYAILPVYLLGILAMLIGSLGGTWFTPVKFGRKAVFIMKVLLVSLIWPFAYGTRNGRNYLRRITYDMEGLSEEFRSFECADGIVRGRDRMWL